MKITVPLHPYQRHDRDADDPVLADFLDDRVICKCSICGREVRRRSDAKIINLAGGYDHLDCLLASHLQPNITERKYIPMLFRDKTCNEMQNKPQSSQQSEGIKHGDA